VKIIHITDSLPFYVGGVSDYAYQLSSRLKKQYDLETYFITVKNFHDFDKSTFQNIFNIHEKRNLFETVKHIVENNYQTDERINIVLEYVGYGYQKRGCPLWLIRELKKLKKTFTQLQLITMFHELYAISNNIKTSTFWLSWLQKYITKEIFYLSDVVKTNTIKYCKELQQWDSKKEIEVLPVFSNVGEKNNFLKFSKREEAAVIFGSSSSRARVYADKERLENVLYELGIKKIYDIGSGDVLTSLQGYLIKKMGKLGKQEIEQLMSTVKFGFLDYKNMPLEKSGIFAAYAAYAMCPIVFNAYAGESIYEKNVDYVFKDELNKNRFANIAKSVNQKYGLKANLENHVNSFLKEFSS